MPACDYGTTFGDGQTCAYATRKRIHISFAMPFYTILKLPSFYQDRLGTNIGKALKTKDRTLRCIGLPAPALPAR
jgi:hypothetical protein